MNIKTTIILLVALVGVGAFVFFTRDKSGTDDSTPKHEEHTLLDLKDSNTVTQFTITAADGRQIAGEKSRGTDGMDAWKLTKPVTAVAETYKVSSLLSSLTSLKSTEQISSKGNALANSGLDNPKYTIELAQGDTKTKLLIGERLPVGDGVYVQVTGHDMIDIVPSSVLDTLDKPASSLRKDKLFETAPPSVQQLTVLHKDGSQLVMQKQTKGWQVVQPQAMPADSSAVEDLASAVINMQPVEFVDDPSRAFGLSKPQATVLFSTAAPSTQPMAGPTTGPTTAPVMMTGGIKVIFGGYDDVNKKNVFAQTEDGTIVKVPASVLDALDKKPLDVRDKNVLDIDPAQVSKITVAMNQPATTQPVAAAMDHVVTLQKRPKPPIGPPMPLMTPKITAATTAPTTGPTTAPASQPTTAPVMLEASKSEWVTAGPQQMDAEDSKVATLLGQFHPLKVEKYLPLPATGKVVKQYTVTILTMANPTPVVLTVTDPGNEGNLVGACNGLTFELLRTTATEWSGDFTKAPTK